MKSKYRYLVLILSLLTGYALGDTVPAMCQVFPGNPNDGPRATEMLTTWVAEHFVAVERGGGEWLLRDISDWSTPGCHLDDGRPRLSALIPGYSRAIRNEKDWSKSLDRVNRLKKEYPNSALAALAEAEYWIQYAWNARGSGYASSVTPDGWALFGSRLEQAEKILIETKLYSAKVPSWYEQMIKIQSALGRPVEERWATFSEGAKRSKTYLPIYLQMLTFSTPKWGGSWDEVDSLIQWSVENTKATEGESLYARMYWAASSGVPEGKKLFGDTKASWPRMKKGFEDLMVRFPKSSWNLNNFAKFACLAGDKNTYISLRQRIGDQIMREAWPKGVSDDYCDSKFGVD